MKILIHGINFSPELTGIGKYSGEMAAWLGARGHEVRVVTAPPYYPQWRIAEGHANRWGRERCGNLRVYRCPLWVPARPSGLKRLLHLASFAVSSFPVMLGQCFWRPDWVMVVEPPLMCAPQALLTAGLGGARAWLHVQDFEVDAAFGLGVIRAGWLRKFASGIEQWLMRRFDRVSTISPRMLEKLHDKKVEHGVLFPNWVDTEAIFPLDVPSPLRAELGIADDRIVALYSGNMGEKQGIEVVLDAARDLAHRADIQFVLCGEGAAKARLRDRYGESPNVIWLPLQPVERLNDLLNMADIHLLPQRADAADLVMPSRLTGMLASGRPVVATAYSGTQIAETVRHCGIVTVPGDANDLVQAVMKLADDGAMRSALGTRARTWAIENLERNTVLEKFEADLLGSTVNPGSIRP
ncbi:MAG TPA: glycosyltransferase WbuB [Gallionella sp.]|nr:glycosyltransferase WbuB [Gallionella sp.]